MGRARREQVRLAAARLFEQDVELVQVAHELRVSTKSASHWRRRCRAGAAWRWPRGRPCRCLLTERAWRARRAGSCWPALLR